MRRFGRFELGFFVFFLPLALTLLTADFAQAQATIAVSGSSATLTKTGYTELVGAVSLTVNSGTTVAGTVEVFLPNTVFSDASGVTLSGTGGLTAATITAIVPSNGIVDINVPAGAGPGASLTISGIRISAVGLTSAKLTAAISSTGNFVLAGQNSVSLVTGLADGLTVDTSAGNTLSISGSTIISAPGAIKVVEGWNQAFSSSVGTAGQTAPTQVIFQVVGLPDNVSVTFPAMVFSDASDGAIIATLSGVPETLTNQSSTNRVTYEFTDSPASPFLIDSFSVTPTVSLGGPTSNGTAFIQVALGPIGALVPSTDYPSTAIPRFAEVFLPPATGPQQVITTLSLPVLPTAANDTFSVSNTGSGGAVITAQARREDGTLNTDVTTPTTISLAAKQTSLLSLTDIFGTGATPANVAVVELTAANTGMVANAIGTIQTSRIGVAAPPVERLLTYVPFDMQIGSDVPVLTVQNATDADIAAQIVLFSSTGSSIATVTPTIKAHGALRQDLASLFAAAKIPLDGYVTVQGTTGVLRTIILNRPTTAAESISSLVETSNSPQMFPFFVFGSGFNTVLTLINTSSNTPVHVTLTPYSPTGTALVTQPVVQSIAPGVKQTFDFESLFGQSGFASGYFTVNLDSTLLTPFSTRPTVAGIVRLSASGSRAVVPFFSNAGMQFYMTPVVETSTNYTGLSIYNPTGNSVTVTLDAFSSAGAALGTATITIPSGSVNIHLLRELISAAVGNDNVLLRITSSANVNVLGLRGTFSGSELIYLRGETP